MMMIAMLLAAAAPEAAPFQIVWMNEFETNVPVLVAKAGTEERFVAVGCSPSVTPRLVPVIRMAGMKDFWAEPGILAGGHRVRFAFDEGTEQKGRWLGRGAFVSATHSASKPVEFISGLAKASTLKVRIYEVGDRYVEGEFAYTGAAEAIAELSRRCGVPSDGRAAKK
jgi:hypothetical protein